ncbi:MAG TPA: hypothetical protein VL576_02655 [Candidatus Paceibacterota bacterium]|jgi:hypothetical protein|nr:hypothetical protein [Candidatus Paceibacterota bacterium]
MKKDKALEKIFAQRSFSKTHSHPIEIEIYNPIEKSYQTYYYPLHNIVGVKEAGINWMIEMCNSTLRSTVEPWFHHAWYVRKHLGVDSKHFFAPINRNTPDENEALWKSLLWFVANLYKCERYKWAQNVVWADMKKDYAFSRRFFKNSPHFYNRFLLYYLAAHVGCNVLHNVRGD